MLSKRKINSLKETVKNQKKIDASKKWHAQKASDVLTEMASSLNGLSVQEAEKRLNIYGLNQIETSLRFTTLKRFVHQFHNILIYVLIVSALITLILGHYFDSSIIFLVIILNAILGFIQEGKAEKAVQEINQMLAPTSTTIRDGIDKTLPSSLLVPGDIVYLKDGEKVPADIRLLEAKNLQIQEDILTGEASPIEKSVDPVSPDASLGDRTSMAYSGTIVTRGKGYGVVVATGKWTELGKIGTLLTEVKPIVTPLVRSMDTFGRWVTVAILILALCAFLIGVFVWGEPADSVFMASVGLAVAAIPEGLPPVLTIILAIGVMRMAKHHAIIRHLPAVETMGAVTVICTDKTGTLTRGDQTIEKIITANHNYHVTIRDQAIFKLAQTKVQLAEHSMLSTAIHVGMLCNDARLTKSEKNKVAIQGNPIDKAFLELGIKANINPQLLQETYSQEGYIPYDSDYKYMATLYRSNEGRSYIYIKGAPERVLEMCTFPVNKAHGQSFSFDYWIKNLDTLTRQGYRVLALAFKEVPSSKHSLSLEDIANGMTMVALCGFIDTPRTEALEAVEKCYHAGIQVKMVTGDHAATASTIGAQVGIDQRHGILLGNDIDKLDDEKFTQAVKDVNIYARTSPFHKLRLVRALQAQGKVVAMTGDGANDAPALRQADIGIAMGKKGASIAKEASAMVLADDNFATIVHAIEQGRIVFDNLRKAILFTLVTSFAQTLVILLAVLGGFVLPITPVQILWVNTITAATLAISLGFEPAEDEVMLRPPRNPHAPLLSSFLIWRILFATLLLVGSTFCPFVFYTSHGIDLVTARTIAVNMLVFGEIIYLLQCRKFYTSMWNLKSLLESRPVLISIVTVLGLQWAFTYQPLLQRFLGTAPVGFSQWIHVLLLSLGIFITMEIEKLIVRYPKLRPACFRK